MEQHHSSHYLQIPCYLHICSHVDNHHLIFSEEDAAEMDEYRPTARATDPHRMKKTSIHECRTKTLSQFLQKLIAGLSIFALHEETPPVQFCKFSESRCG
jgi:hypothetical protein